MNRWHQLSRPILTEREIAYHNGALLSLTVADDGTAAGGVVGDMAFMWLRDQRVPHASFDDARCEDGTVDMTCTDVHPYHVTGDFHASLAISLRVADCASIYCPIDGCPEEYRIAFVDPSSKSWATVHCQPDATEYLVLQAGPRQLWAEVVTAYHWWRAAGSPAADRWRITVTPHEQLVGLVTAAEPPE